MNSEMSFDPQLKVLVLISDQFGLVVLSLEGEVLLQEESFKQNVHYTASSLLVSYEDHRVGVYQIIP